MKYKTQKLFIHFSEMKKYIAGPSVVWSDPGEPLPYMPTHLEIPSNTTLEQLQQTYEDGGIEFLRVNTLLNYKLEDLDHMKVEQLKALCKVYGLPQSGKQKNLIDR